MEDDAEMGKENALERNLGLQPLDAVMQEMKLDNHALVEMNREGLTHKAVQRARKGRRLTPRMKLRITQALNAILKMRQSPRQYPTRDLFNY